MSENAKNNSCLHCSVFSTKYQYQEIFDEFGIELGLQSLLAKHFQFDVFPDPGYWLLYCYQCLALTVSCVTNIGFDSLSSSLFIFIKCQLDLLAVRLDKMGRWNSAGGSVEQQLKQNIRYHMAIVELTATVERLLCKPISMQIFCSVLVLTANFYAIALVSTDKICRCMKDTKI